MHSLQGLAFGGWLIDRLIRSFIHLFIYSFIRLFGHPHWHAETFDRYICRSITFNSVVNANEEYNQWYIWKVLGAIIEQFRES